LAEAHSVGIDSQFAIWLVAAGAAGVAVGWLLWGRTVSGLKAEILRMRLQLIGLEPLAEQLATIEETHRAAVREHESVTSALRARVAELEPLTDWVAELEQGGARKDEAAATAKARIAELEAQLSSALETHEQARHSSLRAIAAGEQRIAELEKSVLEARALDELVLKDAAARERHLDARIRGLQAEIVRSGDIEDRLHAAIAARDATVARLGKQIAQLEPAASRVPLLEAEIAMLDQALTARDVRIGDLRQEVAAFQSANMERPSSMAAAAGAGSATVAAPSRTFTADLRDAELDALRGTVRALTEQLDRNEVARLAYGYALERGFQGGSAEEDWLRAEAEVRERERGAAAESGPN
jgi:hypothetical protein